MPLPIVDEDAPRSGAAQARVFLSYAHEDAEYARRFVMHFQLLSRVLGRRDEDFFYDVARLAPGFRWSGTLHSFLDTTDVLVLLVSVNSLYSNSYCMTHAVLAAAAAGIPIVPVVVKYCRWDAVPVPGDPGNATFGSFGALPRAEDESIRPVCDWPHEDAAWAEVMNGLEVTLTTLQAKSAAPTPREPRLPAPAGREGAAAARTDLIAYLCDQEQPERGFRNALREWDTRALVVLVKGVFDDNPERFWKRLRVELLHDWVERGERRSPPLLDEKPISLPEKSGGRGFKETMEQDLLDALSPVVTGRSMAIRDAAHLAELLQTEKATGVITLLASPAGGERDGIEALLRLIEKLPDDVTARLVVVVSLEDPALGAVDLTSEWRLRRYARSLVVSLNPLAPVDLDDALRWHRVREIETLFQVRDDEVAQLFRPDERVRLRHFDDRVQPLLQRPTRR